MDNEERTEMLKKSMELMKKADQAKKHNGIVEFIGIAFLLFLTIKILFHY